MRFPTSYDVTNRLNSLSEKIRLFTSERPSRSHRIDPEKKAEDLQLNLSYFIAHLIANLDLRDRNKHVFQKVIDEYNVKNKTVLTIDDFIRINWIRTVGGEVVMPELIRHFIWQVGYYEQEGKAIQIPSEKIHQVRCLQVYYQNHFERARPTIAKSTIENLVSSYASKHLSIDWLVKNKVIREVSDDAMLFVWNGGDYVDCLRKEIASMLWLVIGGEDATDIDFKKYFRLLLATNLWVDNVSEFLTYKNRERIRQLAEAYLNSQDDLVKSEFEFDKIWLDASSSSNIRIDHQIPVVKLNFENTVEFIENVQYHKWRFHDVFDYQKTRSYCNLLLRLIIQSDPNFTPEYESTLRILKDVSRPALIWILYTDLPRHFPEVIPYLLLDSELAPLAFQLIDKIEINRKIISEANGHLEHAEIKHELWREMYEIILIELSSKHSHDNDDGELIGKIILATSEKIFNSNLHGQYAWDQHEDFRNKYNYAVRALLNKRIEFVNTYPQPQINPKLVLFLVPGLSEYLNQKHVHGLPRHNEFLSLNLAFINVALETIRFGCQRIVEGELSANEITIIRSSAHDLVRLLKQIIIDFYSTDEIIVATYDEHRTEKRKPKRGLGDFGFELIDWGYLFLQFEKIGELDSIHKALTQNLNFNSTGTKYDDQNKEQYEKLRLYIRGLLLSFISINQKRDELEIEELPVKATLSFLEKLIRELSIKYSIDDPSKMKIDVFDDRFSFYSYNPYRHQLTSLLYQSVNYFISSHSKFIKEFFADTTDIARMLEAVNALDSREGRDYASTKIKKIDIEDFIQSASTTNELQAALIESANSDDHWWLARPLLKKLQSHFKKMKSFEGNSAQLFFEIELLLAFKEGNYDNLANLALPKAEHYSHRKSNTAENTKEFYRALFRLYNEKKYDDAISILRSLLSKDGKNIRYGFQLYKAQTLKAINTDESQ